MTINMRPEARRFITMIDTLYNHKVGENLSLVPRPLPFLLFCLHPYKEVKSFVTVYYYAFWNKAKKEQS